MKQVIAKLKYFRLSPRKVRLVTDLMRGLSVKEAEKQLIFSKKRSAPALLKLLKSALANAKENLKIDENAINFFIKEIRVDEGPVLRRFMPRAKGRAAPIRKRSSHISLIISEKAK